MTRLDDLLGYDDEPAGSARRRNPWLRVGYTVMVSALAAWLIYFVLRASGVGAPYVFLFTVILTLGALRALLSGLAVTRLPATLRDAPVPGQRAEPVADGVRDAVVRWETRIDWTRKDPGRFGQVVQAAMRDIVDERLRMHHGLSRDGDPERVSALLGGELWRFVTEPVTATLTPKDMATLVAKMEAL